MANMNVRPYFDDYDESKGYYRILFRPSYSLQARELTQLQTISQNQISRIGDTILKDGDSLDYGEIKYVSGIVTVTEGVFYINGFAVRVDTSTIGSADNPIDNSRVGFLVTEEYIDPSDDTSLYDNAQGTSNYSAPGAHRYNINLELQSRTMIDSAADLTSDFVEIFRVIDGVVHKSDSFLDSIVTEQKYNEREGEDYITDNFDIEISSTDTDYTVKISDGSAIIDGREVKVDSPILATTSKPQDSNKDTFTIVGSMVGSDITGSTTALLSSQVNADNFAGVDSNSSLLGKLVNETVEVTLHNSDNALIGNAYISAVRPNKDLPALDVYFSGVEFTVTGSLYSDVRVVKHNGASVFENLDFGLIRNGNDKSVFKLPENYITGVSSFSFSDIRKVVSANVSGGQVIITEIENVVLDSFVIIQGNVMDTSPTYSIGSANTFRLTLSAGTEIDVSKLVYVSYDISYSQLVTSHSFFSSRNHTKGQVKYFNTSELLEDLSLDVSLVTDFSVEMAMNNNSNVYNIDRSYMYELDDGQTDSSIGISKLKLKENFSPPASSIKVTFDYWKETAPTSKIGIVNSYQGDYDKIPTYTTDDGEILNLSDCIDLRYVNGDSLNTTGTITAHSVSLYGSRTDIVSLDKQGQISITKGSVYKDEEIVPDTNNDLDLYKIIVSPYGKKLTYERVNNKKLNNTELLSIENRLSKLENEMSISELEQDALISESGSLIHGVLTDPFLGHNVADTTDSNYTVSIDYDENSLRPTFIKSYENIGDDTQSYLTDPDEISDIYNLRGYDIIKLSSGTSSVKYGYVGIQDSFGLKPLDDIEIFSDSYNYISSNRNSMWKDWENSWYGTKVGTNSVLDYQRKGNRSISDSYRVKLGHPLDALEISLDVQGFNVSSLPSVWLDGDEYIDDLGFNNLNEYKISLDKKLAGKKFLELKSDTHYAANYIHGYGYLSDYEEWGPLEDSVSQEFTVYVDSVYTKIDLYFSEAVDVAEDNIYVQIRHMVNGKPSNKVLATYKPTSIVTGKNTIVFPKKVPLKSGNYCITVYGSNSDCGLLCSTNYPNGVGNLFVNQTKVTEKTLKFNLYKDSYPVTSSTEVYSIKDISRKVSIQSVEQTTLTTTAKIICDGHGYSVGDTVQFNCDESLGRNVYKFSYNSDSTSTDDAVTAHVGSYVTSITTLGSTANLDTNKGIILKVDANSTVWIASILGDWSDVTILAFGKNLTSGSGALTVQGSLHVTDPPDSKDGVHYNGYWSKLLENNNSIVYADQSSFIIEDVGYITEAGVVDFGTIDNTKINLDSVYLRANQFVPSGTSIDWTLNDQSITPNTTNPLTISMKDDQFILKATLTGTENYSPVIDNRQLQVALISNSLDPVTVPATHSRKDFYDVENNSRSVYISKPFTLSSTATGLRVKFDGLVPAGNHIMVYMKPDDSDWVQLTTPPISRNGTYESLSYFINDISYGSVRIKILFKGEITENVPKIKNMKIVSVSPSTITAGVETSQVAGEDVLFENVTLSEEEATPSSPQLTLTAYLASVGEVIEGGTLDVDISDLVTTDLQQDNGNTLPDDQGTYTYEMIQYPSSIFGYNIIEFDGEPNSTSGQLTTPVISSVSSDTLGTFKWRLTFTPNNQQTMGPPISVDVETSITIKDTVVGVPIDATAADVSPPVSLTELTSNNIEYNTMSHTYTFKVTAGSNGPALNQYRLQFMSISQYVHLNTVGFPSSLTTTSLIPANLNGEVEVTMTSSTSINVPIQQDSLYYRWEDSNNDGLYSETNVKTFQITQSTVNQQTENDYQQLIIAPELSGADSTNPFIIQQNPTYQNIWFLGGPPADSNALYLDNVTATIISSGDDGIGENANYGDVVSLEPTEVPRKYRLKYEMGRYWNDTLGSGESTTIRITGQDNSSGADQNKNVAVPVNIIASPRYLELSYTPLMENSSNNTYHFSSTPTIPLVSGVTTINYGTNDIYGGNGEPYKMKRDTSHGFTNSWSANDTNVTGKGNQAYVIGGDGLEIEDENGDKKFNNSSIIKYNFDVPMKKGFLLDWTHSKQRLLADPYDTGNWEKWIIYNDSGQPHDGLVVLDQFFITQFNRSLPTLGTKYVEVPPDSAESTAPAVYSQVGSNEKIPFIEREITPEDFGITSGMGADELANAWDNAVTDAKTGSTIDLEVKKLIGDLFVKENFALLHGGGNSGGEGKISYDHYALFMNPIRNHSIDQVTTYSTEADGEVSLFHSVALEGHDTDANSTTPFYNFGTPEKTDGSGDINYEAELDFFEISDRLVIKLSKHALLRHIIQGSTPNKIQAEFLLTLKITSPSPSTLFDPIELYNSETGSIYDGSMHIEPTSDQGMIDIAATSSHQDGQTGIPLWVKITFSSGPDGGANSWDAAADANWL